MILMSSFDFIIFYINGIMVAWSNKALHGMGWVFSITQFWVHQRVVSQNYPAVERSWMKQYDNFGLLPTDTLRNGALGV